jgi:hypothetical protein
LPAAVGLANTDSSSSLRDLIASDEKKGAYEDLVHNIYYTKDVGVRVQQIRRITEMVGSKFSPEEESDFRHNEKHEPEKAEHNYNNFLQAFDDWKNKRNKLKPLHEYKFHKPGPGLDIDMENGNGPPVI